MSDIKNKKIAVLLPCYNEALTVEKVIKDYREAFPTADIYVYDNNSTDGTGEIARKAGQSLNVNMRREKET
ncbi:glycosyltransferase [uncultured Dubosiella sp.]|uniref:glycosyltransferase n=1 Tax=uncultured Dubosiella sp. TaxID=1937011 RepID=UPI0026132A08|nr:glycosyltransferase [uncultured Dubosiella sp.]